METSNGNPAIDRAVDILERLEADPGGADMTTLARRAGVSRSSAYRILNTLAARGIVRRAGGGRYVLGGRLITLGAAAGAILRERLLPDLLRDELENLARRLGETVRLSVLDRGSVLLVAAASPPATHALGYVLGQSFPIHAGGASKVLLANLPAGERRRLLSRPLERYTDRTITDVQTLEVELARVLAQGWAIDDGEFSPRVQAYAAPLHSCGEVVAALSVAFAATDSQIFHKRVCEEVVESAKRVSPLLDDFGAT